MLAQDEVILTPKLVEPRALGRELGTFAAWWCLFRPWEMARGGAGEAFVFAHLCSHSQKPRHGPF